MIDSRQKETGRKKIIDAEPHGYVFAMQHITPA